MKIEPGRYVIKQSETMGSTLVVAKVSIVTRRCVIYEIEWLTETIRYVDMKDFFRKRIIDTINEDE
jgi:hypothetical protein